MAPIVVRPVGAAERLDLSTAMTTKHIMHLEMRVGTRLLTHKSSGSKDKLDIVFANAGVARYATVGKITEELYDSIFDINVKGLLFTVQKALPLLPDGGYSILSAPIVASKGWSSNRVCELHDGSGTVCRWRLRRSVGRLVILCGRLGFLGLDALVQEAT